MKIILCVSALALLSAPIQAAPIIESNATPKAKTLPSLGNPTDLLASGLSWLPYGLASSAPGTALSSISSTIGRQSPCNGLTAKTAPEAGGITPIECFPPALTTASENAASAVNPSGCHTVDNSEAAVTITEAERFEPDKDDHPLGDSRNTPVYPLEDMLMNILVDCGDIWNLVNEFNQAYEDGRTRQCIRNMYNILGRVVRILFAICKYVIENNRGRYFVPADPPKTPSGQLTSTSATRSMPSIDVCNIACAPVPTYSSHACQPTQEALTKEMPAGHTANSIYEHVSTYSPRVQPVITVDAPTSSIHNITTVPAMVIRSSQVCRPTHAATTISKPTGDSRNNTHELLSTRSSLVYRPARTTNLRGIPLTTGRGHANTSMATTAISSKTIKLAIPQASQAFSSTPTPLVGGMHSPPIMSPVTGWAYVNTVLSNDDGIRDKPLSFELPTYAVHATEFFETPFTCTATNTDFFMHTALIWMALE